MEEVPEVGEASVGHPFKRGRSFDFIMNMVRGKHPCLDYVEPNYGVNTVEREKL